MTIVPIYRHDSRHPQAQACAACDVRSSALFGALDDEGLDRIHEQIESVAVDADDSIYGRGEHGAAVYTIRAGVVRFERVTERGDRRIVRLAGRGELIGQEALLGRPHTDEAVACTALQLCRIPQALVSSLGEADPVVLRELMLRWQLALDGAESWVADLASGPARRRVLRLLVRLGSYADADGMIWLPRREEIGAMLDIALETASRFVSQLRREGVIVPVGLRAARLNLPALDGAVQFEDLG